MTEADPQDLGLLAKLVIALAFLLLVGGLLWHGITSAVLQRFWHDLIARPDAPMRFRFILQPLMATIAAFHDGLKDARTGRSPYFWAILSKRGRRVERLREGVNATARIILLGLAMDMIYQVIVLKTFYPNEALVVALLLAFMPYVVIRGPVARIAGRSRGGTSPHGIS
ncbi:MAG TPA: hypothetical protein VMA37_07080 [Acetobacteraceae bacterium]|nr:hypothetical protein [Acetobacteraceae bacterium]